MNNELEQKFIDNELQTLEKVVNETLIKRENQAMNYYLNDKILTILKSLNQRLKQLELKENN